MSQWNEIGDCTMCEAQGVEVKVIDEATQVCAECLDSFFFRCDKCGEFWLDDPDIGAEAFETDEGEILCPHCAVE